MFTNFFFRNDEGTNKPSLMFTGKDGDKHSGLLCLFISYEEKVYNIGPRIKHFKKNYLDMGDYNIISVDWGPLAESPWYTTAAKNAQ